jgi:hypothetical protein
MTISALPIHQLSWPATAGQPGDIVAIQVIQRADARWLGGPVKPGHDSFHMDVAQC